MINPAVDGLAEHVGTAAACALLGRSRASHYRAKNPPPPRPRTPRPAPANKLSAAERAHVLAVLTSQRFADKSVAQVWATLLDEGTYLCSMSTMHRILREHDMAGERRRQASHPPRTRPELVATAPGQVWSWDITKLKGPERGVYYDLYVVLDIFSRYVVAWTVQTVEDSEIAKTMLEEAMGVHGIPEAVHADRGTSMTSKTVATLLADLARLAARRFILGPLANALSGVFSGAGGIFANVLHSGGIVGSAGPSRMVPAMAFAAAPRMHGGGMAGLRHDEVPAILQRGERVLSRREAQSYGASGAVNVTIMARDAESFRQSRTQVAADIARAVSLGRRGM